MNNTDLISLKLKAAIVDLSAVDSLNDEFQEFSSYVKTDLHENELSINQLSNDINRISVDAYDLSQSLLTVSDKIEDNISSIGRLSDDYQSFKTGVKADLLSTSQSLSGLSNDISSLNEAIQSTDLSIKDSISAIENSISDVSSSLSGLSASFEEFSSSVISNLSVSEADGFTVWEELSIVQDRCKLASTGQTYDKNEYVNTQPTLYKVSRTGLIELQPGMTFRVTTQVYSSVAVYNLYDESLVCRSYGQKAATGSTVSIVDQTFTSEEFFAKSNAAKYVVFNQFINDASLNFLKVLTLENVNTTKDLLSSLYDQSSNNFDQIIMIQNLLNNVALKSQDILYGKAYVSFGDSYTQLAYSRYVDKDGNVGISSDGYSQQYSQYRTYPVLIAERHNMKFTNQARSGRTFYSSSNSFGNTLSSSSIMQTVKDADYITLLFGNNESWLSIGTSSDTTTATVWGTFNYALSTMLSVNPDVKIGFITTPGLLDLPDDNSSGISGEDRIKLKNEYIVMCKQWGIPYLDWSDPLVPMTSYGRVDGTYIDPYAKQQRRAALFDNTTVYHPTIPGHRYFSTIIERFLKTL